MRAHAVALYVLDEEQNVRPVPPGTDVGFDQLLALAVVPALNQDLDLLKLELNLFKQVRKERGREGRGRGGRREEGRGTKNEGRGTRDEGGRGWGRGREAGGAGGRGRGEGGGGRGWGMEGRRWSDEREPRGVGRREGE